MTREHPSAEQIHKAVSRRIPTLSLATVYKNLEALKAIGAVADVNPDGPAPAPLAVGSPKEAARWLSPCRAA